MSRGVDGEPGIAPAARPHHVLVVDDDPLIRNVAVALLESNGYKATAHEGTTRVLEDILRAQRTSEPIDLVLLDLQLGTANGAEVCRRLRSEGLDVAIVCMSADVEGLDGPARDAAGFDGALGKPFSYEELCACVDRLARTSHVPPR